MIEIPNILQQNIYSDIFKDKFLLIGTCIPTMRKEIFENFAKEWGNVVSICLEQSHYNQLTAKLNNILGLGRTNKVGFLTPDGSPHCVQVQYASKYLQRGLKPQVEFKHYVIGRDAKIYEVSMEAIDQAKTLANHGTPV